MVNNPKSPPSPGNRPFFFSIMDRDVIDNPRRPSPEIGEVSVVWIIFPSFS